MLILIRVLGGVLLAVGGVLPAAAQDTITTKQFLELCQSDGDWCKEHIISLVSTDVASNVIHPDKAQSCPPKDIQAKAEIVTGDVVNWLHDHSDVRPKIDTDGIEAALKVLYPCKKP